jgi:hypothetical protein
MDGGKFSGISSGVNQAAYLHAFAHQENEYEMDKKKLSSEPPPPVGEDYPSKISLLNYLMVGHLYGEFELMKGMEDMGDRPCFTGLEDIIEAGTNTVNIVVFHSSCLGPTLTEDTRSDNMLQFISGKFPEWFSHFKETIARTVEWQKNRADRELRQKVRKAIERIIKAKDQLERAAGEQRDNLTVPAPEEPDPEPIPLAAVEEPDPASSPPPAVGELSPPPPAPEELSPPPAPEEPSPPPEISIRDSDSDSMSHTAGPTTVALAKIDEILNQITSFLNEIQHKLQLFAELFQNKAVLTSAEVTAMLQPIQFGLTPRYKTGKLILFLQLISQLDELPNPDSFKKPDLRMTTEPPQLEELYEAMEAFDKSIGGPFKEELVRRNQSLRTYRAFQVYEKLEFPSILPSLTDLPESVRLFLQQEPEVAKSIYPAWYINTLKRKMTASKKKKKKKKKQSEKKKKKKQSKKKKKKKKPSRRKGRTRRT